MYIFYIHVYLSYYCVLVLVCVFVCIYQPPVSLAIFDLSGIFYFLVSFGHILVLGNHNNGKIMKIRQEKTKRLFWPTSGRQSRKYGRRMGSER